MTNLKKYVAATACALTLSASLAAGAQVVVRFGAPPPRPREVVPPPPHSGWVWQPGYHRWDGHAYIWVPGAYAEPPRPRAHWVAGHWDHRGGGYVWIDGHWR